MSNQYTIQRIREQPIDPFMERKKLIQSFRSHYKPTELALIFNVSRSSIYEALNSAIRDISLCERKSTESGMNRLRAWSRSIIQYENYYFSNILPRMRLSKLRLDTAPKQRWMQQHGFSPFINALNERKLQSYGINNVTDFWKYLGLKLNYEKDIWTIEKKQYIGYFKEKILPKMIKQGLDASKAPSNSWLDRNGFSVFRRMLRKKLLMTHNDFFKEMGLKVWEKNKWSTRISQYKGFVANQLMPMMLEQGLDINAKPKTEWMRDNGFRPFLAAFEHGRLISQGIENFTQFWSKNY